MELKPETVEEEVLQNVRTLVGVWRSEVPIERELGVDADLLDAPIGLARARLGAELKEMIMKYEPRAKVLSVEFRGDAAAGQLEPVIEMTVEEGST